MPGTFAQSAKTLKAAAGVTPHTTVEIDRPFTEEMADNAALDPRNPQLSGDGVRSDASSQKLASSECLLFETLIAEKDKIQRSDVANFCKRAAEASDAAEIERAKSVLEEHAGSRIDDALIHLVVWDENKHRADGKWYHYERYAGRWAGALFSFSNKQAVRELDYVLGHGNVAFLALHLGIDDSCQIKYDIEAKHTRPINQQDVADLFQLVKDYYAKGVAPKGTEHALVSNEKPSLSPKIGIWGGETLLRLPNLPASIVIKPRAGKAVGNATQRESWAVKSGCKLEQADSNLEHRNATRNMAVQRTPVREKKLTAASWRGATSRMAATTQASGAGAEAAGSTSKDPLADMGVTVSDEGLHWWDVSVAMPVTSYNKLKFDSANNLLTVKNTNDIKPYGLVDLYFRGADLQAKNSLSTVKFSAGLPMASRPLQQPFFGGGFTLAIKSFRFAPLVGIRVQKEVRTTTLIPGQPATGAQLTNDTHSEWHAKLQVMIGFSIQDARKALGLK